MSASFPAAIKTWPPLVDSYDYPQASHVNTTYAEITAMQTELGLNPKGASASVVERLNSLDFEKFYVANVDTYATLAENSDDKVASQASIRSYIAAQARGGNLLTNSMFGVVSGGSMANYGSAICVDNVGSDGKANWGKDIGVEHVYYTGYYTLNGFT